MKNTEIEDTIYIEDFAAASDFVQELEEKFKKYEMVSIKYNKELMGLAIKPNSRLFKQTMNKDIENYIKDQIEHQNKERK